MIDPQTVSQTVNHVVAAAPSVTQLQLLGAGCFGAIIGWYVYYINRYRKGDVQLNDVVTLIGILGALRFSRCSNPMAHCLVRMESVWRSVSLVTFCS